jgi:hypothetical protein
MREFSTAANRGKAGVPNAVPIEFKLDDDVLTARAPTTGQVALYITNGRGGGFRSVESLFQFLSDVLSDADWAKIENKLRDGMDVELLAEVSNYLVSEWSGRPTRLASVSSPTPNGTGRASTGKRPAKVSTTSRSRSTASSTPSSSG